MLVNVGALSNALSDEIAASSPVELSKLIGALEAAKAAAWSRLVELQQHPPADTDSLVDATAMAEILGVTEHWVRDAGRRGRIPTVQLGAHVRYCPSEVLAAVRGGPQVHVEPPRRGVGPSRRRGPRPNRGRNG